jgi:hypothetical protein
VTSGMSAGMTLDMTEHLTVPSTLGITSRMTRQRIVLAAGLLAGLGGCAFPSAPQSHTDRATVAACRAYASRVYDRNNRGDIYSINQTGLPYSNSYQPNYQTNDLAAKYRNDELIDDCVRNTGTGSTSDDTVTPSAERP